MPARQEGKVNALSRHKRQKTISPARDEQPTGRSSQPTRQEDVKNKKSCLNIYFETAFFQILL
jgi:hypothetical protein